ncbi:MAG: hypothetical protein IJD60_06410 [Clostridia bacterium]|nr:hypothetical protein [Clostridia bacterium]
MTEQGRIALEYMTQHPASLGRSLGYRDLRDDLHGVWMREMLEASEDMTLQAHRGSYKTTCLCIVLAVLMAVEPDKNIMFLRKTDDDVLEVVRQVSRILQHPEYQRLTAWLYAQREDRPSTPLRIVRGTASEIVTDAYAAPRGAVQLLGIGLGGSLTGKHADIIVTDDIINRQDRVSRAERERTKSVYMELQNIRNPGGRIINTGTPWHKEDAFTLMPTPVKYDCYSTGMLTQEKIDNLRASMTPSLFAANYELLHIAAENALFLQQPGFTEDDGLIRDGIAHVDAAYGGEDYTALTCAKRKGDTIYLYGRLWHSHVDTVLDTVLAECDRLMCSPIHCENNGDKGYLGREILRKGNRVIAYHESQNKYLKISSYLVKWWPQIVFLRGTDAAYINQIMDYTEDAEHDDAPDSAASVCRHLDRVYRERTYISPFEAALMR